MHNKQQNDKLLWAYGAMQQSALCVHSTSYLFTRFVFVLADVKLT